MSDFVKYAIGDQLSVTDLNGKVYRLQIQSIATAAVAKQLTSIDILAQSYPPPHDTLTGEEKFYICNNIEGDTKFENLILWDAILDHSKTVYVTKPSVFKVTILPIPVASGKPVRSIDEIMLDVKNVIKKSVPDCAVKYEDITETEDNEVDNLKTQVNVCRTLITDTLELSTIRPLVAQLASLDVEKMTNGIQSLLTDIQAQLAAMVGERQE